MTNKKGDTVTNKKGDQGRQAGRKADTLSGNKADTLRKHLEFRTPNSNLCGEVQKSPGRQMNRKRGKGRMPAVQAPNLENKSKQTTWETN